MNPRLYFLTYARLDAATDPFNSVSKFYEDLDKEIRRVMVIDEGAAGFFDGKSLQQGSNWPTALMEALSTCQTLLCMYSPAYFDSDYCGREWQIFESRVAQYMVNQQPNTPYPPFILPVLFSPPEDLERMPAVLKDIQFGDQDYPAEYLENGLLYLMRRESKNDVYRDFLDVLVKKLRRSVEQYSLGELTPRPDISLIKSAFHQTEPSLAEVEQQPDTHVADNFGPRYAEFIYVAARRTEIASIKPLAQRLDSYGDEGERDWKPYWPTVLTEIGIFAQYVATLEGFRYNKISLETDLVKQVRDAQANKRIVVVVVDTWTLCLEKYRQLMRHYDDASFWNSVVLIVWNEKTEDAAKNRQTLEEALQQTFSTRLIIKDDRYFIDNIRSASDLAGNLSVALQMVKMQIINAETRFKKIANSQRFSKPEIPVPGGASI